MMVRLVLIGLLAFSGLTPGRALATTAVLQPVVTGIAPSSGKIGTPVTITGTNLTGATSVNFGTVATPIISNTDTQILVDAPFAPDGLTVDVTVTTPSGTSVPSAADRFTYITTWESFGGLLASSPAAGARAAGTVDAFMTGTDGALWHRWMDHNRLWHWDSLGGRPTSVAAILALGCEMDVFVRGPDLALWETKVFGPACDTGAPAPWIRLGGRLAAEPDVTAYGYPSISTIDVFCQGTDGTLWLDSFDYATQKWSWKPLGGRITAAPSVVAVSDTEAWAFASGADRALWYWSNLSGWHPLGGRLASKPAVTLMPQPNLHVDAYVKGDDEALWHWNSTDGSWESIGGRLAGAPTVIVVGARYVSPMVWVQGTDGALWLASSTPSFGQPWGWEDYGGLIVGQPAAVSGASAGFEVFVEGRDRALWHYAAGAPPG